MSLLLTPERLQLALPRAPMEWLKALCSELPGSSVDTKNEVASFVAQLAHESDEFSQLEENLNYSAEGLVGTWPKHFQLGEGLLANAYDFHRKPRMIANYVYGIILAQKLGNLVPEDGWKHRGFGSIQLTGLGNHTRCGAAIGFDLVNHPERLKEPIPGIRSALWFWKVKGLDQFDDDEDVQPETKKVNGGVHGLQKRQRYRDRLSEVLEL